MSATERKINYENKPRPDLPRPQVQTASLSHDRDVLLIEMCPVCRTLELLGGKWRFPAIWQLYLGQELYYNELKRRLFGITNIMLTRVLRALEEQHLVKRTVIDHVPPRVIYALTEKCSGLLPALEIINAWGNQYMSLDEIKESKGSGQQDEPSYLERCLSARTFEILGGKWRLSILWQLLPCKSMRYNELKRHLPGITNAMLTRALQNLERYRLIRRTEFCQIPPHVEYASTKKCAALLPALEIISCWGKENTGVNLISLEP